MKKNYCQLHRALCLLAAFALWTALLGIVDVQPIGPMGSVVGFARLNSFVHELCGVHMGLYILTDWLGLIPLAFAAGFSLLGLMQWISRKKLRHVDCSLLALGGFYILVFAAYFFFESHVVNYRPILIDGRLEASYPSSTTLLVLCVMPSARLCLDKLIKRKELYRYLSCIINIFTVFMVLGRLISGVHWFSDIIGAILLSGGLVSLFRYALRQFS